MSFDNFFDDKVIQDDRGLNQLSIEKSNHCNVERLEFGYIQEVYWEDTGIKHSHIYHESSEIPVDEIWEVQAKEMGSAPLELLDPENEPNDKIEPDKHEY
jgi:hypothetical protein